ncbi:MAG: class I SAM-dependent methyltransferase, partial [Colwellia sp.]
MTLKTQLTLLIDKSELSLTENQIDLLIQYVELLDKWNKAYNLTAVRDTTDMLVKHIMDSLMVGEKLKGQSFIDVGT